VDRGELPSPGGSLGQGKKGRSQKVFTTDTVLDLGTSSLERKKEWTAEGYGLGEGRGSNQRKKLFRRGKFEVARRRVKL